MHGASVERPPTRLPPVATTVDWWPLSFRLRADREDVVRWFRHHLCSVSTRRHGDRPARDTSLTAVVDAALARSMCRSVLAGPTGRAAGYLGETWTVGEVNGDQVWCGPGATLADRPIVVFSKADGYLVVGADGRQVASDCVRVARELLRMELARQGSLTLHASMAADPGRGGLLFVGGTGAGKTTLAVTVARTGGYLVSVDQTEVLPDDDTTGAYGIGFPWPARLGVGMLAAMGLDRTVEALPLLRAQKPIEDGRITAESRRFRSLHKIELSLLELDAVLGVVTLDRAPVNGVVLIGITPPGAPMHVERSTLAAARNDLMLEFREPDPVFGSFWMTPPGHPPPPTGVFDDLCAALETVPLVRLEWRADEHSAVTAVRDITAALDREAPDR